MAAIAPVRSKDDKVFPPDHDSRKRRQPRTKGQVLEKTIGFRPVPELREWIDANATGGRTQTAVIVRALEIARDAGEVLGVEWWEVEKQANIKGTTPGAVLGALALAALQEGLLDKALFALKKTQK
jgi:hypothetical protein